MSHLTLLIKPASAICDLACKYCFYSETESNREKHNLGIMTNNIVCALIDRAFETRPNSISFVFQGGEPLLCGIDFYRNFISAVHKRNTENTPVQYTIQTNGVRLNEDFAQFFKEEDFLVGVSLDGIKEIHDSLRTDKNGHGSFHRVKDGIALLEKYNIPFNILTVLTAEVCEKPREIWSALTRYRYLQFIPYIPKNENDPHKPSDASLTEFLCQTFHLYSESAKADRSISVRDYDGYVGRLLGNPPASCSAAGQCGGYLAIESDGSVYPCDFYMDDKHMLGSIFTDSIKALYSSEIMNEFLNDSVKRSYECTDCPYIALCQGGCHRLREQSKYIYCKAYRDFFANSAPEIISLAKNLRPKRGQK